VPNAVQRPRVMTKPLLAPAPPPAPAQMKAPSPPPPAPAVRVTFSAYAPASSATKKRGMSPFSAQRGKHSTPHSYGTYALKQAQQARQTAMIALRERITCQSQSALKASVVPVLTQALRDAADPAERQRLARALGQLGPTARAAVPLLIDCYRKATEVSERSAMLLSLGQIGPAARQALKDLAKERTHDPLLAGMVQRINSPEGRSGIEDECECFSLKAIQHEQGEIRQLATMYHLEVLVETVANHGLESVDKAGARKTALGRSNVYLRINKDAGDVQVHVSDAVRQQGLTDASLRQVLEPYVKNKEYDRALRAGVDFIGRFEKANSKK
jgi:hypothetical protein